MMDAVGLLVGGIVLVDSILGIGIAGFHDVLDEGIEIHLQVGVPALLLVDGEESGIVGVVGVQTVHFLPLVGDAVVVGVETGRTRSRAEVGFRVAVHVGHHVDDAGLVGHAAGVGGRPGLSLMLVAGVDVVAVQRSSGVGDDLGEGILGFVGGHLAGWSSLVYLDAHAVDVVGVLHVGHVIAVEMVAVGAVALSVDGEGAAVVDHALPVVVLTLVGCCRGHVVAVDVVAAGHADKVGWGGVARGAHGDLCHTRLVRCGGTGLVVVVHHVDIAAARSAVATACAPVVDDAVAEVHDLGLHVVVPFVGVVLGVVLVAAPLVASTVEAGGAVLQVLQQVVVERGEFAAPDAAVAVGSFPVAGVHQTLGDGAPLHGEIVVVVEGGHLVDAPRERAMVDHHAVFLALPEGVGTVVDILLLSAADADEADHVVRPGPECAVTDGDAGVGGGLSGDGGVVADGEVAVEGDHAAHVEDDDFLGRAFHGFAQ